MKKIIFILIIFAFIANVSAQLKVDSLGNITFGNASSSIFGTNNNNIPITFKMKNTLAGNTGNGIYNNVSFGYGAMGNQPTGQFNTANGAFALLNNSNGSHNTAFGCCALCETTSGNHNTAIGEYALLNNDSGYETDDFDKIGGE